MERERRRARLTPLEHELRAGADPRPPRPSLLARLRRRRRERRVPETLGEMLVRDLVRSVVVLGLVGGAAVGIALLVGRSRDWDVARSVSMGLYLGGAVLIMGAFFLTSADMDTPYYRSGAERGTTISSGIVYIGLGVCLIGLGFAAETLL